MALVAKEKEAEYSIKPENVTPALDTSTWPLLLRNYDKRELCFPIVLKLGLTITF